MLKTKLQGHTARKQRLSKQSKGIKTGLRVSIALAGGLAIPVKGFLPVFVYTFALLVAAPKVELGSCVALHCCLLKPQGSGLRIARHVHALDAKNAQAVFSLFTELAKNEHLAVVMVTHDNSLAKMCDKIYTMKDGVIDEN